MKHAIKFSFVTISLLCLAGCSTSRFTLPTATPSGTFTLPATQTPTLSKTPTPTKTLIPTATPLIRMGERHELPEAGFAFRVPIGYASQIEARRALISDLQGTLVISLASVESTSSEEEIIDQYLGALASKSEGEFHKTPSDPVMIGRIEGKAFDLTGSLFGSPLKGKTFIIPLGSNRFFYGLAIANDSQDEHAWDDLGAEVLEAVLESVELIEPKSALRFFLLRSLTHPGNLSVFVKY